MKLKSIFSILLAMTAVFFAASAAMVFVPETALPDIAQTFHVSVDTLKAFVQFAFTGQAGTSFAACTLVGHLETCDEDGNTAGIQTIWFANKNDITSFTISGGQLTAITMVATKVFYKWQFEPDTAFFNQPRAVVNRAPVVKQNLQFTNTKMTTALLEALKSLDACAMCGLVAIIKDMNGKFWLAGVKVYADDTYSIVGVYPAQSDGAVTGANSESDSNKVTTAFESKAGKYAIESTVAEGSIPV